LQVVCRLPDAAELGQVYASSLDLGETAKLEPQRNGDTLTLTVPKHGRSTVILLSRQKEAGVRTGESPGASRNAKAQRYRIARPGS
jgi:hypothetical protein